MMKHLVTPTKALSLVTLGLLSLQSLSAQIPVTNTPPPNELPPPPLRGGPMANLTKEERMQLKAAHDKAIQLDPTLEAKMKAARQMMDEAVKSMHDAMLKVDPSLAPILEKIAPKKWGKEFHPSSAQTNPVSTNTAAIPNSVNSMSSNYMTGGEHYHEGHGNPPGFENLTPAEQQQVKALHEKVKSDPSVVAAKLAMKSATTPEARHAAKESLHQAMHDAMLKADPSIAPILEKLRPMNSPGAMPGTPPPHPPQ